MNHVNLNPLDAAVHVGATRAAIAFAEHSRWESVLRERVKRAVLLNATNRNVRLVEETKSQIQRMVEKMPDVALKFLDRCHRVDGETVSLI